MTMVKVFQQKTDSVLKHCSVLGGSNCGKDVKFLDQPWTNNRILRMESGNMTVINSKSNFSSDLDGIILFVVSSELNLIPDSGFSLVKWGFCLFCVTLSNVIVWICMAKRLAFVNLPVGCISCPCRLSVLFACLYFSALTTTIESPINSLANRNKKGEKNPHPLNLLKIPYIH